MKVSELVAMKNDYITVVEWKTFLYDLNGNKTSGKDQSYIGDCMKIIAIDENLLRVERLSKYAHSRESFTLDMNKVVIRKLSNDFVYSIKKDIA